MLNRNSPREIGRKGCWKMIREFPVDRWLKLILAVTLMMFIPAAIAKAAKPVVYLQPICTYDNSINNIQLDETHRRQLDSMIKTKLRQMAADGDLPYELREVAASDHHSSDEHLVEEDKIFLYPAVIVSSSIDTANNNTLETAYTSTVIAGVSLLFCMPEENLNLDRVGREGNTVSLRLLGIVPLAEAETIGIPTYDSKKDVWRNLRREPISQTEKADRVISLVKQMLKEDISFSNIKSNLKDDKAKLGNDTYQVVNVGMSSKIAQEMFPGQEAEELKFLVGYYFTAAYQKKTKRVVYPPAVGSNPLADKIVDAAYKISLDSINGRVDVAMSNPKHPIRLDISGMGSETVESGDYVYTFLHKVWLAKSPVEGDEKAELSRLSQRTVKLPPGTSTDYDDKMVYSALLLGLAQELGGQKR